MNLRIKSLDEILATASKKSLHRSLGAFQLTMLGVGAIIGTGIFVLTAEAAQKAGPAMMLSFVVAGFVCAVTALCYAEMASMIPVSGSAYTYSYAVLGELLAWVVGWALILEYAIAGSTVAVGWSGYVVGLLRHLSELVPFLPNITIPDAWALGPFDGGSIEGNLVSAGTDHRSSIFERTDPATGSEGDGELLGNAANGFQESWMVITRSSDVQHDQFVSALDIVTGSQFDRIAGITEAFEVDAFYNAGAVGVEAGNDAVGECHAARRRKFSRNCAPGAPLFSG